MMEIKEVSFRQILSELHAAALFAEYAEECSLPELGKVNPQEQLYDAMERSGGMKAFAVYAGMQMIGFATLLIYSVPHYGKKIAATESVFVSRGYRSLAGNKLLAHLESFAKERGCEALLYSAPFASRFAALLQARKDCRLSNSIYLKKL